MRLSTEQARVIRQAAAEVFGDEAGVWLFGSRADDTRRGGDIDLLVSPVRLDAQERLLRKIRFLACLERCLGERKVDVVIEAPGDERPIVRVAHQTGVRL
ncbi:nucleotidyltransferase family protein [Aromatoleum toluclasticum]|uniref:nucleotidyltransferase family protein n=1 Tax=Aromatoleum toluclasticum TaxID=92003 RepID=UPI000476BD0A|nr:nucleotidyltransferase domain-containing protein [Aromatoleum toluclasticum]